MLCTPGSKSKEPRCSRVDEALVVGTLGGEKLLHSLALPSLVRSAIGLGWRIFCTYVWLENILYLCLVGEYSVLMFGSQNYRIPRLRKRTHPAF